ncbi:MAG: hypothetical protein C4523_11590 [Myxococcales bacterium]|nr:MAG: hypothetical protein C4523_11590 [Myxococcales bacterium]
MIPTLVVDADPARHALYQDGLGKSFALTICSGSVEAIAAAERGRFVAAIVHADLDGGGGVMLCQRLRKVAGGEALGILLVGETLDDAVLGPDVARRMGANAILKIPFDVERLRRKARDLVAEIAAAQKVRPQAGQSAAAAPSPPPKASAPPRPVVAPAAPADDAVRRTFGDVSAEDFAIVGPERLGEAVWWTDKLEQASYYDVLTLPRTAGAGEAKLRYFDLARRFHPDRFALVKNEILASTLGALFKRASEAYQTLSNPDRRKAYDEQLDAGGELRYVERKRETKGPKRQEEAITNPQARKFYQMALAAINDENWPSARLNLALAAKAMPGNEVIQSKIDEVKAKLNPGG